MKPKNVAPYERDPVEWAREVVEESEERFKSRARPGPFQVVVEEDALYHVLKGLLDRCHNT